MDLESQMNNILIISPFFFPEPISTGKYNTLVAKELSQGTGCIDVLCAHPIYPKWKIEPTSKQLVGVNAIRGGKYLKFPKNVLLRRAVLELWFCIFVFFRLLFSKKKYTHIVPIFPPSLFMILVPFFTKKAKITGIVHDLQGIYAKRNSGFLKKIIFSFIKTIEKKAFRNCDQLIFLSEDMMRVASSEYDLDPTKNSVNYPFVTIDEFSDVGKLNHIIPDNQVSIVYSGALGEKQAPNELAEFMESVVQANSNVKAYIFSQGPEFELLKNNYTNINFHPLVDEEDLSELLVRSTVQILPQAQGTSDGSLPSKLPNLLASGCKIFCITDPGSELVRILNSYSNAAVEHEWDNVKLSEGCLKLLSSDVKSEVDNELLSKFRIQTLVDKILTR
ncbi:hypothetical protein [Neptuniibacter sp. UBA6509]|uniref:hypothetical protein n=1 Tax=Neptuniibacter sp. UBA6509 TaxID=1946976 RepID=UPI0025EFF33D|nr:hypothetical protein [Neptuniibacter sp. UBA6509]|tara:strand:- start:2779 stop:3948 length:1170 start_codon:yes stop_codon:yes gene_type:complete